MKYLFLLLSSLAFAQQTQFVDFKSVSGQLTLDAKEKSIAGSVHYKLEVLRPIDTIKIDAQNMSFTEVKLNDKDVGKYHFQPKNFKTETNIASLVKELVVGPESYQQGMAVWNFNKQGWENVDTEDVLTLVGWIKE
jgi:aminopeptidase N